MVLVGPHCFKGVLRKWMLDESQTRENRIMYELSPRVGKLPGRAIVTWYFAFVLMFAATFFGLSTRTFAQEANRILTGCTFTLADLKSILSISGDPLKAANADLAAVTIVVYANKPNLGQTATLPNNNTVNTGPLICTEADVANGLRAETAPIPDSGTADIKDVAGNSAIRYHANDTGYNELQVCQTSGPNGDCLRALDLPPSP